MVVGRDTPYVSSLDEDYLSDLAWTIGQWKPEATEQGLQIEFDWMAKETSSRTRT